MMYSSMFTYNITRPYPFKWFTPLVFIGGSIAIVLFSILNLVSNGYYLQVNISTNPNATVSQNVWFANWPSYLTAKVQSSCQTVDISTNSQFFTNQSGLTYTLTGIWQDAGSGAKNISPSLTYQNNIFQDCVITAVEIDLESFDRLASQIAYTQWGAQLWGYTTCDIMTNAGLTKVNLTAAYNYIPATVSFDNSSLYSFVSQDQSSRASLWWGESLLSMYWVYLTRMMQVIRESPVPADQDAIRKGTLSFTTGTLPSTSFKRSPEASNSDDISSLDFFDVSYRFVQDLPGQAPFPFGPANSNYHKVSVLDSTSTYPNIWVPADSLAKALYSTILTDLGQTTASPNILTDPLLLQSFTSSFPSILNYISSANVHPGPALQDFHTLKSSTGDLGTTPSVIFTKYICQVPTRKPIGTIFVSVLIADLVLLQASWTILKLLTEWLALDEKKGAEVNYCKGCLKGI